MHMYAQFCLRVSNEAAVHRAGSSVPVTQASIHEASSVGLCCCRRQQLTCQLHQRSKVPQELLASASSSLTEGASVTVGSSSCCARSLAGLHMHRAGETGRNSGARVGFTQSGSRKLSNQLAFLAHTSPAVPLLKASFWCIIWTSHP